MDIWNPKRLFSMNYPLLFHICSPGGDIGRFSRVQLIAGPGRHLPAALPGSKLKQVMPMDEEEIASLIQDLRHGPRDVRRAAVRALYACARHPLALQALAGALDDGDRWVRRCAARALAGSGDLIAAQALIEGLRSRDQWLRRFAAESLSARREPEVAALLLEELWRKDYWSGHRYDIMRILGRIRDPGVIESLIQHMHNPFGERWMRGSLAALALQQMAEPLAVPGLMALARPAGHFYERGPAIRALAGVGTPEAIRFLIEILESADPGDQNVKRDAAWALRESKAPEAVPALLEYLRTAPWQNERLYAIRALGKIGDARAVPALLEALNQYAPQSKHLRKQAARALAVFEDPEIFRTLAQGLQDPSPDQRARAAWALGEIGDPRALRALRQALEDADARVREVAAQSLKYMGWSD